MKLDLFLNKDNQTIWAENFKMNFQNPNGFKS